MDAPSIPVVFIEAAKCSQCGLEFTADYFTGGARKEWPVPLPLSFARMEHWHSPFVGGCGGTLFLSQALEAA